MTDSEIIKMLEDQNEIESVIVENPNIKKWMVNESGEILTIEEVKKWYYNRFLKPVQQKVKKYEGDNSFIISLQKYLRNTKNCIEINGRKYKCLTEKQYIVVKDMV
jgi:hypothetical protein